MRYTEDPLAIIYENTFLKQTLKGSSNTNDGLDQNNKLVTSLIPAMNDIHKSGGNMIDFVKYLRNEYGHRYENMDVELQRDILKTWTEVTGDRNPTGWKKGNLE